MTPPELRWLIQQPPASPETFAEYRFTLEFYREIYDRQKHKEYCDWYRQMSVQHQRELIKMRRDINILGWFYRDRAP